MSGGLLILSLLLSSAPDAGIGGELFLYGFGARTFGLGRAYTGATGSSESVYYNPAALSEIQRGEITFSYTSLHWLHSYGGFSSVYPVDARSGFGFMLVALRTRTTPGRDIYARPTSPFSFLEAGGLLAYARRVSPQLSLGATGKFYYGRLQQFTGAGIGFDIGAQWRIRPGVQIGAAVLNVIPPIVKYFRVREQFPRVARIGVELRPFPQVRFLTDWVKPGPRSAQFHAGLEVRPLDLFAVRFGYDPKSLSAGFGIWSIQNQRVVRLDYAISQTLGLDFLTQFSHRLTITVQYSGYHVWAHADPKDITLRVGAAGVLTYIYLHVRTKAHPVRWQLQIYAPTGEPARVFSGDGLPPLRLAWDGRDATGRLVPRGRYRYRLEVEDANGERYVGTGDLVNVLVSRIF